MYCKLIIKSFIEYEIKIKTINSFNCLETWNWYHYNLNTFFELNQVMIKSIVILIQELEQNIFRKWRITTFANAFVNNIYV